MATSSSQRTPSNPNSLFGTTRRKDPFWMAPAVSARQTSTWRQYYRDTCTAAGFPRVGDHLVLSTSFKPHSPTESAAAYKSIIAQQVSDEDSLVMILTLSYDHDHQGKLSAETWKRVLAVLRQLVEPPVKVQLWVDKIDSDNLGGKWGIRQLLPYVLFPVVRTGSKPDAGFMSNMEALAAIFGKGLYHDRLLDDLVIQDYTPVQDKDFFVSRAATWNAVDAIVTFYLHLMYGCLSKYRNHHKEVVQALSSGAIVINLLLMDPNNLLEVLLGHERNSVFGDGRFEIQNGVWCRTDTPGWHGLKEWITLDTFIHPIADTDKRFQIKGFVNVYAGEKMTMAVVHWELASSGWTRRLFVELRPGSKEHGKALIHHRIPGYRQAEKAEVLERERITFDSKGLSQLYSFDSHDIQWE